MDTPTFEPGTAVLVRATGEVGVVIRSAGNAMLDVSLPGGVRLLHFEDLQVAAPEPSQLLLEGRLGDPTSYGLRLQSLYLQHAYRFDPLSGLSNARIEPKFHQVFVAWRVTQKLQPRMILSDEVGLGKTIEAGLIIKELRARGLANRVLIVCPASLQLQWQQELKTKFNEAFEVIDRAALKYLGRGGTNPWARFDSVICSLPLASHRTRVDAIVESDWDLVVFDEAHRVRRWLQGRKPTTTQAYRFADELKELVSGFLLLTATPMQLHPYELYSLIELVEPGLFPTFQSYEVQKRELPALNDLIRGLRAWTTLGPADAASLCARHAGLLREVGVDAEAGSALDDAAVRDEAISALAERHPLADVLVRNRKSEVGGFVGREAHAAFVDLTEEEYELYSDITEYCRNQYNLAVAAKNQAVGFLMVTYQKMLASSGHAIRASFERRIAKLKKKLRERPSDKRVGRQTGGGPDEDELDAEEVSDVVDQYGDQTLEQELVAVEIAMLEGLVERLGRFRESKAYKLLDALDEVFRAHPDEKVLVFTSFKETQAFLRQLLQGNGHSVSIFNGSLTLDEKEEAVRSFRLKNRVMISTEAGGEGRNFQFCHIIVNYDLPWNPMKVEQRIGRVDRIGQTKTIHIWNLACRATVEERVLRVLERRIGLFEESVGSLEPILGTVEEDIVALVMSKLENLAAEGERFELALEQKVREARETERRLADFALDRASLRRDIVNKLLEARPLATHQDLEEYARRVLVHIGGTVHPHADGGKVITLSPGAAQRLRMRGSTIRGCFDPQEALRFEELQFFAFGNQVVQDLLDVPVGDDVQVAARRDPTVPPGTWLEFWYEMETRDVRPAARFVRHLVGDDLQVHSTVVRELPAVGERIQHDLAVPGWASDAIRASQDVYHAEYEQFRGEAKATLAQRQREETARAQRIFNYRLQRLEGLIADEAKWVQRAESGGSERDKRILPARRGKLEKRREDLRKLKADHEADLESIRKQEPRTVARMLAAGMVVGE